ncbi:mast cell protease 1A isoform X1 [Misgurnus anguillicaudatus]|uniref:mast cell protease 1A isoform X1 n=1 Tax=Misgurnus anguillicaudatus TaxID=75329 RepID=UPI003CCF996B
MHIKRDAHQVGVKEEVQAGGLNLPIRNELLSTHLHIGVLQSSQQPYQRNIIMIILMLLLGTLLPHLTLTEYANVRIINGTEAKPHSRPYMVSVQKNGHHFCGGFLVSEQFVITAAHCFIYGDKLKVVVGAHELNRKSDPIAVKFYHIHPDYNSKELLNDIMILQLNKTIEYNKTIKSIPIPEKDKPIEAKTKCSVAGWGAQKTSGSASKQLMEVNVTIFDDEECQKKWKNQTTSSMVCTFGKGGFCQGDSGGPLVCNGTAVGVVSFNENNNCDKPTRPNVYTRISKFLTWINAILKGVKQDYDY